jgi:hypothetical protein
MNNLRQNIETCQSKPTLHGWTETQYGEAISQVFPHSRPHRVIGKAILSYGFTKRDGQPTGIVFADSDTIAKRADTCRKQVDRVIGDYVLCGLLGVESRYWQTKDPKARAGKKRTALTIIRPGSLDQLNQAVAALLCVRQRPRKDTKRLSDAEIDGVVSNCGRFFSRDTEIPPLTRFMLRALTLPVSTSNVECPLEVVPSVHSSGTKCPLPSGHFQVEDAITHQDTKIEKAPNYIELKRELNTKSKIGHQGASIREDLPFEERQQDQEQTPTPEQVEAYCISRRSRVDPHAVHALGEAVGWLHGNKALDWQAMVRRCEREGQFLMPHDMTESEFNARRRELLMQRLQPFADGSYSLAEASRLRAQNTIVGRGHRGTAPPAASSVVVRCAQCGGRYRATDQIRDGERPRDPNTFCSDRCEQDHDAGIPQEETIEGIKWRHLDNGGRKSDFKDPVRWLDYVDRAAQ